MEEPSNPSSHMDHSAFAASPLSNSSNPASDHAHHLPSFPTSSFVVREPFGPSNSRDRQAQQHPSPISYSSEVYPKDAFDRDGGYGRDAFSKDAFARDSSFSADTVVNFSDETFSRDPEPLNSRKPDDADVQQHPEPAPFPASSAGVGNSFPGDGGGGGSSSTDERSSKKVKRTGGWWRDEDGVDRPAGEGHNEEHDDAVKEMEATDGKEAEIAGSFVVGSVSSVGVGMGVSFGAAGAVVSVAAGDVVVGMVEGSMDVVAVNQGAVQAVVVGVGSGDVEGDGGGGSSGGGGDGDVGGEEGDVEGGSRDFKGDKDGIGKKKRAELWQDAEMDALVGAYRQIHIKLAVAGKKGKHVFKSANEKWREVRNLLLSLGVDRQPKEIERKWSNLSTAFKQIADWNKKVGRASYWELDEVSKKEKTKAKELPATFRVQLYEAMAEFLGDRTAARRSRGWSQYEGPDRLPLPGTSGNGVSGGSESTSGILDIPLPMDKLPSHQTASDQKRLRVVLVATGSYNPPTYMHVRMFELARDALIGEGYDVLGGYMSPVNDAYGKKGLAPAEHRIMLCQIATSDSSFIMVDPWEAKQGNYQRTLTVLSRVDHAVNTHGFATDEKVRVMLLCGADLLESIGTPGIWIPDQVQALCHDYGAVCIPRDGKDVRKIIFENDMLYEYRRNFIVVDDHITNDISSTKIRRNLGRGLSVKYLTPDAVIHYIKTHRLYDANQL